MITKKRLYDLGYFALTCLIIMGPALYNRYPLVYFDSGAYMEMSASLEPSFHRSIGYPLIMRITGWLTSNWPIVFIQALLINLLTYKLIRKLEINSAKVVHFLAIMILSFTTSLSWYASQLMPDIFTLITALTTVLILLEKSPSIRKLLIYGMLLFVCLTTHLSHIPLILLVLLSFYALNQFTVLKTSYRSLICISGALAIAFVFVSGYNAAYGHGFRLSLSTNVFLTANIAEMGFLKWYLEEKCPKAPEELCAIMDDIPNETGGFLWHADGPVQQSGPDWKGLNERWKPVVDDFLYTPRYLKWLVFGAVKSTLQQMFQIELGSGLQYTYADGSPPSWPMRSHYSMELNEYLTSVQNKDASHLPLSFFKVMNYISLFLSLLIIGWCLLTGRLDQRLAYVFLAFLLIYFYNAAITGVLANVYERLQTRLLPLFPLLAILFVSQMNLKSILISSRK